MTLYKWSKTAATNANADSTINWAEGMAPSAVNDSARAEMAAVAKFRDDTAGSLVTGGTSTAYTITSNQGFDTLAHLDGQTLSVHFNAANGAAATLAVDSLTAAALQSASGIAVRSGAIAADSVWDVTYVNSIPAFLVHGIAANVKDASVTTSSIADKAVTLQKLYHPSTTSVVLGSDSNAALTITGAADNGSGLIRLTVADSSTFATGQKKTVSDVTGTTEANGTWTITVVNSTKIDLQSSTFTNAYVSGGTIGGGVEEIAIGAGLQLSAGTLTAPATPVPAAFKNLSIKVASTTTVTVASDFVTTTDGTNFKTTAVSSTINLGTTGANALDTGTIAIDTWYAIWIIAKADGTTEALASTSSSSPTMPTGYTFKARVGWVRTVHASATLYGTWQLGRRVQYVVGLAQTATLPTIASGISGDISIPTWTAKSISSFVPATASEIHLVISGLTTGGVIIAPNNSYGGNAAAVNVPPIMFNGAGAVAQNSSLNSTLLLESTNIYYAASSAQGICLILGWTDNI